MLTRTQVLFLQALAIFLFGCVMTGLYWLMTGINEDFGLGIACGLVLGIGMTMLASKNARETP